MNTLSILTDGFLPNRSPLSVITHGYLSLEAAEETYSGGYFDYEALRPRKRYFKPKDEEERQAKPILEAIDRLEGPGIDTTTDLELVLRLRLRTQGLEYKALYLTWLEREFTRKQAIIRKKRRNKAITLLLLH